MKAKLRTSRVAVVVLVCLLVAGQGSAADRTVLRVGGYVTAEGALGPAASVVIDGGAIRNIAGLDDDVAGARVIDYSDAVLCPGLIDVHSALTAARNDSETAGALDPQLVASDFFDRHHRDLRRALCGGITTALLSPAGGNLLCGWTVAVKTGGWETRDRAVVARGPMKISLADEVWSLDREPTSRVGTMHLLRQTLAESRAGEGFEAVKDLLAGRTSCIADCPTRLDVEAMLVLAGEYGFALSVLHGAEAIKAAAVLSGSGATVILPPGTFASPQRVLAGPAALERVGVDVAFAGQMPEHDADAIRMSAALAVRYGLSAEAARRGMTINAARVAGLDQLIGSIEAGKQADLVVFSGDPLGLDARVLAVYVNGERVFLAGATE